MFVGMVGSLFLVSKGNFWSVGICLEGVMWGVVCGWFGGFYRLEGGSIMKKWGWRVMIGWGMVVGGMLMWFYEKGWELNGIWVVDIESRDGLGGRMEG